ncbi:hypothetical protein PIB30_054009 [Stylosanthes scabra]|uniref:Methyltransferase small domain-containing protein n=1 Tax=Stylosanthes scabra TaxID=79078 RepID=A0ABU6VHK6_9FABA|nr:hypothetical protein [Stylosanthes scabra]
MQMPMSTLNKSRSSMRMYDRRYCARLLGMRPKPTNIGGQLSSTSEIWYGFTSGRNDFLSLVESYHQEQMDRLESWNALMIMLTKLSFREIMDGYVITSLALILGRERGDINYIATDVNPNAVKVSCEALVAHGVSAELILTDIASGLENRLAGLVDVIVVNPPYVPTPEEEVGAEGVVSSWAGGENGRSVIDRILPVVDHLLSEKGLLYMVTSTANNPSEICLQMKKKGYSSKIIIQRSTEEESLHIIKFWRDFDTLVDEITAPSLYGFLRFLLAQIPLFSLWRGK